MGNTILLIIYTKKQNRKKTDTPFEKKNYICITIPDL